VLALVLAVGLMRSRRRRHWLVAVLLFAALPGLLVVGASRADSPGRRAALAARLE
jgi:hypothetical protein